MSGPKKIAITLDVANQAQAMELVVDDLLDKYRRKASDRKR